MIEQRVFAIGKRLGSEYYYTKVRKTQNERMRGTTHRDNRNPFGPRLEMYGASNGAMGAVLDRY